MSPLCLLTSGLAVPFSKVCPRKYVLLFRTVETPVNEVSIATVADPPLISNDPSPENKVFSNLRSLYPNSGAVPTVEEVATCLSCHYFKTPVVESHDTTLPIAVEPNPTV